MDYIKILYLKEKKDALDAYDRFFKKIGGYPKFKKKKYANLSCRTHEITTLIENKRIKFEKLGWVKCHNNIPLLNSHISIKLSILP